MIKNRFIPKIGILLIATLFTNLLPRTVSASKETTVRNASATVEDVYIRVNQVGYSLTDSKIAHAQSSNSLPQAFSVVDVKTGQTVFRGPIRTIPGSWGEFDHHADLDFSAVIKPGTYFIRVGSSTSPQFQISPSVYSELPDQLLEFMRQQRCGYNPWLNAVCHPFDGRMVYAPLPAGTYMDATGGWHDAGDQLKYLLTSSNATAQMLLAYVLAKHSSRRTSSRETIFGDHVNHLGQPVPNNIPDILDEARWGLDWMLKLHPQPDWLFHQVADDRDHKGWRLPQDDKVDYGWGPGNARPVYFADGAPQGLREYKSSANGIANLAGRYAAAMALGYEIWKNDSSMRNYALRLLKAGKEVYALGRIKEGMQQGNCYGAPYRYEESTWADDMEWGAAELFRATKNLQYLRDAKRYAKLAAAESWMGREQTGHYQFYPFMNMGHFRLYDLVDPATKRQLANYYREGIDRCLHSSEKNPYRMGVPFIWCSNNLVVALVTQSSLYEKMTGNKHYGEFTSKQRDWLLGRNPWGFSMFTEIPQGGTFPRDLHLFGIALLKRPVRGGLVDGPVYQRIFQTLRGVHIRQPDPLAIFQDERAVFHDDINDYSTNEPTMDGTASAILMWAISGDRKL